MRDLRVWIERGPQGSRAGLEVVPALCAERGHVPAGVLALLVDVAGGDAAVRLARPGWVATSDLVLHLLRPVASGVVTAAPELLRTTRSTLVLEVRVRAGSADGSDGTEVGLATMTFARLAAHGEVQRMGAGRDEARTEFGGPGAGLAAPLPQALGARCLDPAGGVYELPLTDYVINSMGALQGGVVAVLVDLAAETAARALTDAPLLVTDLALNYLALGRLGPIRSEARVLRRETGSWLARVELRDAGPERRLTAVATVAAAPL